MLTTKERPRTDHDPKATPEFRAPERWLGKPPHKAVQICFAATNVEEWETGTGAVVSWGGKRFRIVSEGKDVAANETSRGILVGE